VANALQTERQVKMPGASEEQNAEALLDVLKMIGHGVSATLGDGCEVVVHDLEHLEHSIVFISASCPQAGTPRARPEYLRPLCLRPTPAGGVRYRGCGR
jgi:hypothetical protein